MDKYEIAKERYLNGDTIKNICSDLKIGNVTLSNKLKLDGIQLRGVRKADVVEEDQIRKILSLRDEKKSIREISKIIGIERHKISLLLKIRNEETKDLSAHEYNENIFDEIDTEEKAYWLGFLYADGHITEHKNILALTLQTKDRYHLEKFAQFIGGKVTKHSTNAHRVSISNRHLYCTMMEKGCIHRKSLVLEFPNSEIVPDYLIRHFIRGYMDGDGHIGIETNKNGKTKSIIFQLTGTFNFLNETKKKLKAENKVRSMGAFKSIYELRVKGNEKPLRILDWLYEDATIYLQRKYDIYMQFKLSKNKANAVLEQTTLEV